VTRGEAFSMRGKVSSVEDGRAEHSRRVKGESERAKRGGQAFGARFGDVTWSNRAFFFEPPTRRPRRSGQRTPILQGAI